MSLSDNTSLLVHIILGLLMVSVVIGVQMIPRVVQDEPLVVEYKGELYAVQKISMDVK